MYTRGKRKYVSLLRNDPFAEYCLDQSLAQQMFRDIDKFSEMLSAGPNSECWKSMAHEIIEGVRPTPDEALVPFERELTRQRLARKLSLRQSIKLSGPKTESEAVKRNETDRSADPSNDSKKLKKKTKNQGKAKTFKRKTKRPGRV